MIGRCLRHIRCCVASRPFTSRFSKDELRFLCVLNLTLILTASEMCLVNLDSLRPPKFLTFVHLDVFPPPRYN